MTWYRQSAPATPQEAASKRALRGAVIALTLFLPVLLLAKLAVLSTERGGHCLMRGGCDPFPDVLFLSLAGGAVAAFVVATATRRLTLRRVALGVQLLLETVSVFVVLAHP
ncbi:hypothetical protein ACFVGY_29840 [Streptomyces sp. NPDC127106]|uniref:hypothetical protein n=1 Tax=Streptomyces sp. NPDC127106 TaxID=3345360 RepID=UPI003633050B